MVFQFNPATKERAFLRLALFGPSGSGKTYTALRLATGMGGQIAVIDTERGSASKYADRFEFSVLELPPNERDIKTYCAAIMAAERAGFDTLIIDSLTHAWRELLAEVDKLARAKYGGNRWSAWSEGTPMQTGFVDTILGYRGHVIATMRTKTEWTTTTDDRGKVKPVRLGLEPEQGKGIEYEFDLLMELTQDHIATVTKDRTGRYQDEAIECPGEDLGKDLAAWLSEGVEMSPRPRPATPEQIERVSNAIIALGANDVDVQLTNKGYPPLARLTDQQAEELLGRLAKVKAPKPTDSNEGHWLKDERQQKRYFASINDLNVSPDEAKAWLHVESMYDYAESLDSALRDVLASKAAAVGLGSVQEALDELHDAYPDQLPGKITDAFDHLVDAASIDGTL